MFAYLMSPLHKLKARNDVFQMDILWEDSDNI